MTLRLEPGEHHDLVLEVSDRDLPDEHPDPERLWAATEEAWSEVAPSCDDLIAVADARHAYAVLRGLTSASGAMVAAATTSRRFARTTCRLCDHVLCDAQRCPIGKRASELEQQGVTSC